MKHLVLTISLAALIVNSSAIAQPAAPGAAGKPIPLEKNAAPVTPPAVAPSVNTLTPEGTKEFRVSRLFAATVHSANNEKIGTISEIIFSGDGKILYVVVGVGGFLGIFGKRVALPLKKLKLEQEVKNNIRITSKFTRAQLEKLPTWIAAQWLDEKGRGPAPPPAPRAKSRGRF